ncbi:protein MHF1 homolog isoform X3 [Hibiscus syriacus]|uniref:protein MHF1 homolog isoform X3 n=1 Tax=Hibiscus syriacus TaxID=106335 RepID=UPI00192509CA|nr:protein MHF1 homolog isoform X3 [Hibiscus syriacus]
MEIDEDRSDFEKDEEEDDDSVSDLLRDRFRLSAISIAEYEAAKRNGMEISQPIVACIADLAFKYIGQLAKDLELFAHHAGRKSVTMADVIVSAHRNEHLVASSMSIFHINRLELRSS